MANQSATTVKDVKVPGNSDVGCTRACNGNSTCGGVCGAQCYKQVFTDPKGLETIGVYSCRGDLEIVDPKPRTVPKTQAAFLSTIGSPQFDLFEGSKFDPYINDSKLVIEGSIKKADDKLCKCGSNTGCENCQACKGQDGQMYECFCWQGDIGRQIPGVPAQAYTDYKCAYSAAQARRRFNTKPLNTGVGFQAGADYQRGFTERHM